MDVLYVIVSILAFVSETLSTDVLTFQLYYKFFRFSQNFLKERKKKTACKNQFSCELMQQEDKLSVIVPTSVPPFLGKMRAE